MIEHKTVSLADQVFEQLENEILSGRYQRGEVITENMLSTQLGVSRTPIREALRRLSQEHLIEESGKGSVVIGISEKDVEDIFLIRTNLECFVASLAARNRTEEGLEELKEALEFQEFYLKKQDAEHIKHLDSKFHETLYKLSGRSVFYDTLLPLHRKTQKYRKVAVQSTSRAEASVLEHRRIYEAIAAKDEAAALQRTKEHIENAHNHLVGKDK